MPRAELIFANVVDTRIKDSHGDGGPSAVYCMSVPGRAVSHHVIRAWKGPQGLVNESFSFTAPSGKTTYSSPAVTRKLIGMMDVTYFDDVVTDAQFTEAGLHVASFAIDREVIGQIEFEVYMQAQAQKLPKASRTG